MELLMNLLEHIHSFRDEEYIRETERFLNERGFVKGIDNLPLDEIGQFKFYKYEGYEGFADWVTVKLEDGRYYSVNLRALHEEDQIMITNSEKGMIRNFMRLYNPDRMACILTINENYEAINTRVLSNSMITPLNESASTYTYRPLITDKDRKNIMYEMEKGILLTYDKPKYTIYDLFEFVKEFTPELKEIIAKSIAFENDKELFEEYKKQAVDYAMENGIDGTHYRVLAMYKQLLKETKC